MVNKAPFDPNRELINPTGRSDTRSEVQYIKDYLVEIARLIRSSRNHINGRFESLESEIIQMAGELNELKTEVAETRTAVDSAIVFIKGLKDLLDAAIASGDPAELKKLSDELNAQQTALAEAIVTNTPLPPA